MKKVLLFLVIIICSCEAPVKTGVIQSSFNIKQSKDLGVYVNEYIPSEKIFKLGDKQYEIEQVWIEYLWGYKNIKKDIDIHSEDISAYLKFKGDVDLFDIKFDYMGKKSGITGGKLIFDLNEYPEVLNITFKDDNSNQKEIILRKK